MPSKTLKQKRTMQAATHLANALRAKKGTK